MKPSKLITIGALTACILGIASSPAVAKNDKHRYWDNGGYYHDSSVINDKHSVRYIAKGKVVDVEPLYYATSKVSYEQQCWLEPTHNHQTYRSNSRNTTLETLVGAALGGAIGNQIGSGSGNKVATIAGIAVGGAIANDNANTGYVNNHRRQPRKDYAEVCSYQRSNFDNYERELKGYNVVYKYKGKEFETFTEQHPGKFIDLEVSVTPRD